MESLKKFLNESQDPKAIEKRKLLVTLIIVSISFFNVQAQIFQEKDDIIKDLVHTVVNSVK